MRHPFFRFIIGMVVAVALAEGSARLVLTQTPPAVRWYDASTQLKVEQMDDIGEVDVVFAGTSMAWQAFNPTVFEAATGLDGYNAGLAGGTPEVMERWLLEEVEPRMTPDVVVWGLSSLDLAPAYGPAQRAVYDEAPATRTGWLAQFDRLGVDISELIANRSVFRSVDAVAGATSDDRRAQFRIAEETLGPRGERLDFAIDKGARRGSILAARLAGFAPDPADIERIADVIEELRRRGVDVVIAQLPVPHRFRTAHPNGLEDYESVGEALDYIATQSEVRLLRVTSGFDDDDFVDFTHLSEAASIRFTERFGEAFASQRDDRGTAPGFTPSRGSDDVPTSTPEATDCILETLIDEYGFEIEVQTCGDTVVPLVDDTRDLGDVLVDAFVLETGCAGEAMDPTSIGLTDSPGPEVRQSLSILASWQDRCDDPDYRSAYSEAVSILEAAAGLTRDPRDRLDRGESASRALAAIDVLHEAVDEANPNFGYAWYHSDEIAALLALEALGTGPLDHMIIGSSVAATTLSPSRIAETTGGQVTNLAMAGADAEEWAILYPRVVGDRIPDNVVWGITTHRLLDSADVDCSQLPAGRARVSERLRERWFPVLGREVEELQLLLGSDLATSPVTQTPAFAQALERWPLPGERQRVDRVFRQLGATERRYPGAKLCAERLDLTGEVMDMISATGTSLTIALLPLHPDTVEAAPEQHEAAREALLELAASRGISLLELDRPYADEETYDGWHATRQGSDRVSDDLAAALLRAG